MSRFQGVIVHCSATPPSWMHDTPVGAKREVIKSWHVKDRGWKDIGYNWIIDRDGTECGGRDLDNDGDFWEEIGAHTKGQNSRYLGICLIGGHGSNANDDPLKHFTEPQLSALRGRIELLQAGGVVGPDVRGHNEFAAKACPGFNVPRWWNGKPVKKPASESKAVRASGVGIGTAAASGVTAIGALDGTAQIVAIVGVVVVLGVFAYLMRDRLQKLARGIE